MKKILLLLAVFVAVSCSKDEEKETPDSAQLRSFEEPFIKFGTSEEELMEVFGDQFETEPNELSLGYKMVFQSERDGEYQRAYSLDNSANLWKTEVRYYGTPENLELIKKEMESRYGTPEKGGGSGLTVYRYKVPNADIELKYLTGSTEAIVVFSEP